MVVLESSALIPLAWVGWLDLVSAVFEYIETTGAVEEEVLVGGKPGTAALRRFFDDVEVHDSPAESGSVADAEGIAEADASVILQAADRGTRLLANDKAHVTVARGHGVECWWVTTLLLHCAKAGVVDAEEATDSLYDLVDAGMNLSPQVYAQVQRRLEDLGASHP